MTGPPTRALARAQSDVVGVALMLGVTVVALGLLTASIGGIVQSNADTANAARVAAGFEDALRPVESTGVHHGRVSFTDGELRVVERELRVLDGTGVVETVAVDALVYENGANRVGFLAGAIVRGTGDRTALARTPPITASRGSGGVLVVGAPVLSAPRVSVAGDRVGSVSLASNVTHERTALGTGEWRVAVETETPDAWRSYFERADGVESVTTADLDGDEVESVVATFAGSRTAYLVVHDMRLSVDGDAIDDRDGTSARSAPPGDEAGTDRHGRDRDG